LPLLKMVGHLRNAELLAVFDFYPKQYFFDNVKVTTCRFKFPNINCLISFEIGRNISALDLQCDSKCQIE